MTHLDSSALAAYNSLSDPHLQSYFSSERIQQHLRQAGLINNRGEIVTEGEYRTRLAHREHRKHVRHMLAENIVSRAIDLERARLAEMKRQQEFLAKAAMVNNIKESRRRAAGYSPLMALPSDFNGVPYPSRPRSANNQEKSEMMDGRRVQSAIHHSDDEDFDSPTRTTKPNEYRRLRRHQSLKRGKSLVKLQFNNRSHSKGKFPNANESSPPCQITMVYYGPHTKVDFDHLVFNDVDEVIVMQQHCGGENRIAYKKYLKAGDEFTFVSRRHADYPFGLSLYVKGLFDSRISTCCEYKHRHGVKLGGDRGHFAIKSVQGSKPCIKCRFEKQAMLKKLSESPKEKKAERSKPIVIPVSSSDEGKHDQIPLRIPLHTPDRQTSNSNENYDEDFDETDKEKDRRKARVSTDGETSPSERSERKMKKKDSHPRPKSARKSPSSDSDRRKDSDQSRRREKKKSLISNDESIEEKKEKILGEMRIYPSNRPQGDFQPKSLSPSTDVFLSISLFDNGNHRTEKVDLKSLIDRSNSSVSETPLIIRLENYFPPETIQLKLLSTDPDDEENVQCHFDRIELIDSKEKDRRVFKMARWIGTSDVIRLQRNQSKSVESDEEEDERKSTRRSSPPINGTERSSVDLSSKEPTDRRELIDYHLEIFPSDQPEGSMKISKETRISLRINDHRDEYSLHQLTPEFQSGEKQRFAMKFRLNPNEKPKKVTMGYVNDHRDAEEWHLDKIRLINVKNNETFLFRSDGHFKRDPSTNRAEKIFHFDENDDDQDRRDDQSDRTVKVQRKSSTSSFPELNDDDADYKRIFQKLDPNNELGLGSEPTTPRETTHSVKRASPPVDPLPNLEDLQQQQSSRSNQDEKKKIDQHGFAVMYSNDDEDDF